MTEPLADQMCCVACGYVAPLDCLYDFETTNDDEFPVCPKCGEWNIGGESSFAPWDILCAEHREIIYRAERRRQAREVDRVTHTKESPCRK